MDKRRRAGVIAASGGAIAASTSAILPLHHSIAGLGDFWVGAAVGVSLGTMIVAMLMIVRGCGWSGCS